MIRDILTLGPRHNIMGDISSLGVLGATTMHYLPDFAYVMPVVYYTMLSINVALDWHKRWKNRK